MNGRHRVMFGLMLLTICLGVTTQGVASRPAKRCSITDFGAVGDGRAINTAAIQAAIDKCAADGGGMLVVPAGTYVSGAIFLKQGVDLLIEKVGVLKGTTDLSDYKFVKTRWEGEERVWVSALVNAFDMTDVSLSGEGTLDGSGDVWFAGRRAGGGGATKPQGGPPGLGPRGGLPPTPAGDVSKADDFKTPTLPDYARPRLIAVQNCRNVLVKGLTLKNQASWGLFLLYSRNVKVQDLIIRAEHYIPSSDGIDVDSCSGVHIARVDIDVNDDCIAIKSGKDEDGRRVNRPCENVLVENSVFRYGHGGVSMGSEMSGGIRDVEIRECVMMADNWAPIRFKSQPSRGGVVENITYRDIKLENTRAAFEFNMEWRMVNPKPPADPLPVVRNIKIINVTGATGNVGLIRGLPGSPIRKVSFKKCEITAKRGLRLEHGEDLDLSGLKIHVPDGVEPIVRDSKE